MNHIDNLSINAIRVLSADAIQKAKSGHPGLPLGAAPIAYELWAHHMNHNPANPDWRNRDRFILSGGHGSMLLYSLLYLYRYGDMTLDDLKEFRQLDSKTPGHPEYRHTVGVEATTGPLGAGMGMAVGMAIAEKHLASVFNKEGYPVIDHYTYALGGDGCMMEGISSEAFSLAGTLGLSKLIILYDSNNISIEGSTDIAFTEDVQKRMESFGFQTLEVADGNDIDAVGKAIEEAKAEIDKPTIIIVNNIIGYGCLEKQGTSSAHGDPLGEENVAATRANLNWEYSEAFYVPQEIYNHYNELAEKGQAKENRWLELLEEYKDEYPEDYELLEQYYSDIDAEKIYNDEEFWKRPEKKAVSTRVSSGVILNRIKELLPNFVGGAADVAPSTRTYMKGVGDFSKEDYSGRNFHFGIREMAMGAIGNGLMLHGGLKPFVSCFFVFSDYMKPMMRLSALMQLPVTYVLTHDSIGVGEDGPTHHPIEQANMLRSIPNFVTFRPADKMETAVGYYYSLTNGKSPVALLLSRQDLPELENTSKEALKGGYILVDSKKETPDMILIASGSEVSLVLEAKNVLMQKGIDTRVVSMPSTELFEMQAAEYKESVLPDNVRKRVAVEALSADYWYRYVGLDGKVIGMTTYGESAPANQLFDYFGFTTEHIVEVAESIMK